MYRLLVISVVLAWVGAMTALVVRDVLPAWTAQDAPRLTREHFAALSDEPEQFAILGPDGRRLGTGWGDIARSGSNTSVHGTMLVEKLGPVSVLIETMTEFDAAGELDTFNLDVYVYGVPTRVRVRGERRGIYFPCEFQVGTIRREANLDLSASRLIGDTLRPFNHLPDLKVGQSWRMQLIDPLSLISGQARFTPIVVTVTGTDTIEHLGSKVQAFVVHTRPGETTAWVAADGRVLKQEADVPGLGRIVVQSEAYSEQQRNQARERYGPSPARSVPAASRPSGMDFNLLRKSLRGFK